MRLRSTCTFVAVLFLLRTQQLRAQGPGNAANQPDGASITAADSFSSTVPPVVMSPGPGPKGVFGPVAARPKAGDPALDILYTKVLHSPGSSADPAPWTSANFSGQVTVITFFPDTTDNLQAVTRWNALLKEFSNKPVEFVWLTGEKESSLLPWLAEHPVEGWVLLDAEGETGRAYGLEMPEAVIIGADRNIVGFDEGMEPTKEVLNAALEGRIRTEPVKPEPAAMEASLKSGMVLLKAEPRQMPGIEDHKPKFPPSDDVHITPSTENGTSSASGGNYWSMQGFSLKMLIAETYDMGMEPGRIDFPDALAAEKRYDVALVLPEEQSHHAMMRRVQEALQEKFNLTSQPKTAPEKMGCARACPYKSLGHERPFSGAGFRYAVGTVLSSYCCYAPSLRGPVREGHGNHTIRATGCAAAQRDSNSYARGGRGLDQAVCLVCKSA
jgi:AhpC/TSA family